MDYVELVIAIVFTSIATVLNWSERESLQRILYPLWVLGMCLPFFFSC